MFVNGITGVCRKHRMYTDGTLPTRRKQNCRNETWCRRREWWQKQCRNEREFITDQLLHFREITRMLRFLFVRGFYFIVVERGKAEEKRRLEGRRDKDIISNSHIGHGVEQNIQIFKYSNQIQLATSYYRTIIQSRATHYNIDA